MSEEKKVRPCQLLTIISLQRDEMQNVLTSMLWQVEPSRMRHFRR